MSNIIQLKNHLIKIFIPTYSYIVDTAYYLSASLFTVYLPDSLSIHLYTYVYRYQHGYRHRSIHKKGSGSLVEFNDCYWLVVG